MNWDMDAIILTAGVATTLVTILLLSYWGALRQFSRRMREFLNRGEETEARFRNALDAIHVMAIRGNNEALEGILDELQIFYSKERVLATIPTVELGDLIVITRRYPRHSDYERELVKEERRRIEAGGVLVEVKR